mmetsp:Transcript_15465/g.41519  ORF Transcript_15465/g.41519 Transcript_15465/m.41519 type:complete len:243 (-) Transcript_15465:907-1635(-)|eukprot:CAMPEP_0185837058 /NCGR_PEP_ID=MMETSP1353-20130828/10719_1 /TAXON_ID=1077150 /ORGANISM="Erythrolobus australicus, Strain CCMP3124" /LENGTH=242 /DNA_ID=CAMNT_0028535915 /DNA_START=208 /DNA_END=936 /DNA_ORIENTATION=+
MPCLSSSSPRVAVGLLVYTLSDNCLRSSRARTPLSRKRVETESARNFIEGELGMRVVKGFLSPVNDAYDKPTLISARHRIAMCERAVCDSKWIRVETWEANQPQYVRSHCVLRQIRATFCSESSSPAPKMFWVCGSDVASSMADESKWPRDSVLSLLSEGSVLVMPRPTDSSSKPTEIEWLTAEQRQQIRYIPPGSVPSADISSTLVRQALERGLSARYMTPDAVLDYIEDNKLWKCDQRQV